MDTRLSMWYCGESPDVAPRQAFFAASSLRPVLPAPRNELGEGRSSKPCTNCRLCVTWNTATTFQVAIHGQSAVKTQRVKQDKQD